MGRNLPPRILKLSRTSNIPPRLLKLREEQHQHQPNIPPRILKLREQQQSKKSMVTCTENMVISRLQQQSLILKVLPMLVQHIQEQDPKQKKESSVDYARLTSFLEKDNSFLTPWNWKPETIGLSSSSSEEKQYYSMHSERILKPTRTSNIPPRLLKLRDEQHQHPSNIPPRMLNRQRKQHQPNIPPRILKLREEQQSKKSMVTSTENMVSKLQQQSMLQQVLHHENKVTIFRHSPHGIVHRHMLVQHSQEQDKEQKKEEENVLQESSSVDYAPLTSFLEKDNSFLTPWNWKPENIGHSSSSSEEKQYYSVHSESYYSFNVRERWVR